MEFSSSVTDLIRNATELAKNKGNSEVLPEHLVLAVYSADENSRLREILSALVSDKDQLVHACEAKLTSLENLRISDRLKQILAVAADASEAMSNHQVDEQSLALALAAPNAELFKNIPEDVLFRSDFVCQKIGLPKVESELLKNFYGWVQKRYAPTREQVSEELEQTRITLGKLIKELSALRSSLGEIQEKVQGKGPK